MTAPRTPRPSSPTFRCRRAGPVTSVTPSPPAAERPERAEAHASCPRQWTRKACDGAEFEPPRQGQVEHVARRDARPLRQEADEPTMIKGHKAAAPKNKPEYIVKSDKSGKTAVHKPTQLNKT